MRCDAPSPAGTIFDHHRLTDAGAQVLPDEARHDVGHAGACRKGHQQAYRASRIALPEYRS
jgi:hypothetical protein